MDINYNVLFLDEKNQKIKTSLSAAKIENKILKSLKLEPKLFPTLSQTAGIF